MSHTKEIIDSVLIFAFFVVALWVMFVPPKGSYRRASPEEKKAMRISWGFDS